MVHTDTEYSLRLERHEYHTVARVQGSLAYGESERFARTLSDVVTRPESDLILDLSGLASIDSSGLGSLVALVAEANTVASRVVLAEPTPFVVAILESTKLDRYFTICPTVAAAAAHLGEV